MHKRLLIVILMAILFPQISQAWWNEEWSFRKPIKVVADGFNPSQIKTSLNKDGIPELTVLVRLHSGNFGSFFMDANEKGNDVRFIAGDDKTALKYHIEKWDALNNMALVWVKVPIENTAGGPMGGDQIWMYYGNPSAAKGDDYGGSFDENTALLYHFENAAGGVVQDRTAYGLNPDPASYNVETNLASILGVGAKFNGKSIIKVPQAPNSAIDTAKGWTFSTWIKLPAQEAAAAQGQQVEGAAPVASEASQEEMVVLHVQDGAAQLILSVKGSTAWATYIAADGGIYETPKTAVVTPGKWKHLSLLLNQGAISVLVDGRALSTVQVPLVSMQSAITIGAMPNGSKGLIADVDEIVVSSVARSIDWMKALVAVQGAGSSNLVYGEDEDHSAEGGSMEVAYLLTILKSIDTIGWADIGILMFMALVCVVVIINKQMYLGRVLSSNKQFLKQFKGIDSSDDSDENSILRFMGDAKQFRASNLFKIYFDGATELKLRVGSTVGAQAADLRQQSVDAIKAAMDASVIRELQRLNSQMVLLTISISGGPFLGLLGTVLGVMITFAAIAATGDVNISAIAPGVSAALMTTVAGLFVAIPALFAYNWLNSKIKNITVDMKVFTDEMISKIAEQHS